MGLNKQKGNMYDFVTHTWNTVKGPCFHDCEYCYMKGRVKLRPVRFDAKELKTDLGSGNRIFVGSSNDMFAGNIQKEWVWDTLHHCIKYPDNVYYFQSKNPKRMILDYGYPKRTYLGTTIETNRENDFSKAPSPSKRALALSRVVIAENLRSGGKRNHKTFVTIEPIMDFDLPDLVSLIKDINPDFVVIGADSRGHNLPEPPGWKIGALIKKLNEFTTVNIKPNLSRIYHPGA